MLVVMCGLPGVGKSTIADALGRRTGWPVLAVDPAEAAMTRAGIKRSAETGLAAYVVVGALVDHLLGLGQHVVVDAVNDAPEARRQWVELAGWHHLESLFVEVTCSDAEEHRRRLESRRRAYGDTFEPRWSELAPRRALLTAWSDERVVLDSMTDVDSNVARVAALLDGAGGAGGADLAEPPSPSAPDGVDLTP